MNLDINIGDVILGGKFKNKRIVVKKIGTDELGQPIINKSRKLLAVRIEKKLPEGMWSTKSLAEKYKEKDMDKKAFLEETYNKAFNDELEKISESYAKETAAAGATAGGVAGGAGLLKIKTPKETAKIYSKSGDVIGKTKFKVPGKMLSKTKTGLLLAAAGGLTGLGAGALIKKKKK